MNLHLFLATKHQDEIDKVGKEELREEFCHVEAQSVGALVPIGAWNIEE